MLESLVRSEYSYPFIPLVGHYLVSNLCQFLLFILSSFPKRWNFLFLIPYHPYENFLERVSPSLVIESACPYCHRSLTFDMRLWGIPCTSCVCDDEQFMQLVVLVMGVVSFWFFMGRLSIFLYIRMSSSLAKAFTSKVAGWCIMVLKLLQGSLSEVEAIRGIAMWGGHRIQRRKDILLPWSYLLLC